MALIPSCCELNITCVPPGACVTQENTVFPGVMVRKGRAATGCVETRKGLKQRCEMVTFAFSKTPLAASGETGCWMLEGIIY